MKKYTLIMALLGLFIIPTYSQMIDDGQFNLGVSTSINASAVADVQTGKTVDGRTNEAFARLRLAFVYLKLAYTEGEYAQTKLERFYDNKFWSAYGEAGLQTSPDYLTFGGLGLWGQAGAFYGRTGNRLTNYLIDKDQVLVNVGPFWGYTFGAGLEYDGGEIMIGNYEISPAIMIERVRLNYLDDFTWDGIRGGVANDALKSWRISLMIRFGSFCNC